MTNLDIWTQALAAALGRSPAYWQRLLLAGIAASGADIANTKLLETVPKKEAKRLLRQLYKEREGILAWAVEGAKKAQAMPPAERQRMQMFLDNQQN